MELGLDDIGLADETVSLYDSTSRSPLPTVCDVPSPCFSAPDIPPISEPDVTPILVPDITPISVMSPLSQYQKIDQWIYMLKLSSSTRNVVLYSMYAIITSALMCILYLIGLCMYFT